MKIGILILLLLLLLLVRRMVHISGTNQSSCISLQELSLALKFFIISSVGLKVTHALFS